MLAIMEEKSLELSRVIAFVESFRDLFPRSDQLRWLALYIWGLLETPGRRSIEGIARSLPESVVPSRSALSQSLQHFLSRSPWDDGKLLSEMRRRLTAIGEPGACWVIHDAVFPKRGKHSVGVHRQFFRGLGLKANCQTAVMISQVGQSGWLPLTIRLYLPRGWIESATSAQKAGIPESSCRPHGKDDIGLQLLDQLLEEGKRPQYVAAASGYAASRLLEEELNRRGLRFVQESPQPQVAEARCEWLKERLGMDHYEGRSWRGWHHHATSVLLAYAFLAQETPGAIPALEPND